MLNILVVVIAAKFGAYISMESGKQIMICNNDLVGLPELVYKDNHGNTAHLTACRGT
jgi:hypothetical protein